MTEAERQTARAERAKKDSVQREQDLRGWLSTPGGQRVAWSLIDRLCNVFGLSFARDEKGMGDPLSSAFNEGRRSVGVELMRELQDIAPKEYRAMVSEAINTQNYDAAIVASERVPTSRDGSAR